MMAPLNPELSPAACWRSIAEAAANAVGGQCAVVWGLSGGPEEGWRCMAIWPSRDAASPLFAITDLPATMAAEPGQRWSACLDADSGRDAVGLVVALPAESGRMAIAVSGDGLARHDTMPCYQRLEVVAGQAAVWVAERMMLQARRDVTGFADIIDFLAVLNGHAKFMSAAMALCNELATRVHADRVSLGWLKNDYIRVMAISHMEHFERKMESVQSLEAAMEEAFEQDCEVVWPPVEEMPDEVTAISRDHARYGLVQTSGNVVSIPLRRGTEPVAVITVERASSPFSESDVRWLRLCADQVVNPLAALEAKDAWIGRRCWRALRKHAARLVGVEHTGAKLLALAGCVAMLFLFFGRWPHRVKGEFSLKSEVASVLPAPFDGYLEEVAADKGDLVAQGELLAALDIRDLLIEQVSASADLSRYTREGEKARAENDLASMRMAEAMADQSRARLALIDYRLSRARIVAPFHGAVVGGDLRERVGAPVRQGDVLFEVAQLADLYVEVEVDERDIDYVMQGAVVGLVFASRPTHSYPARVRRIDAMAQPRDGANVFVVQCRLERPDQSWWRPGMSGVARIEAGRRTPAWLLTRRTLDYLRLRWGW